MKAMPSLSSRDRRALAVGVVVIGGGWATALGLPALRAWERAQRAETASALHDMHLAAAGARALGAVRDSLAARRARLALLDSGIVAAGSPAEAGAMLSSWIADVAESAGVRVASLQIRGDTVVTSGFARVAVRLAGTTDVTGLATLVRDIEGATTLAAVRELSVSQPEPLAAASRPEALRFDLLAETFARVRRSPAGATR